MAGYNTPDTSFVAQFFSRFSHRARALKAEQGLSTEEIADLSGLSEATVAAALAGKMVSASTVDRILIALNAAGDLCALPQETTPALVRGVQLSEDNEHVTVTARVQFVSRRMHTVGQTIGVVIP